MTENLLPELEHLWREVPGRNKHNKVLVGVIYRSCCKLDDASWFESFETLLAHLTITWDGMLIITGETNFDLLKLEDNLAKRYSGILNVFGLQQVIKQPTRVTRHSRTLIDHLITNQPTRVTASGIIPCSIVSNHDSLYACINVCDPRFESCHKFIQDTKSLDELLFIDDFSKLPLSVTSFSDDPDEQLDSLNLLFTECLERHAPLQKVKVTRHPAPWMKTPHIEDLQQERNTLRHVAHLPNAHSSTWNSLHLIRNKLKQAIRSAHKSFIEKALSSNKSREIWCDSSYP